MPGALIVAGSTAVIGTIAWAVVSQLANNVAYEEFITKVVLPLFDGFVAKDSIPFACIFFAFLITQLSKIPVLFAQSKEGKGYDNKKPRDQQSRLKGWGLRALSAHQNSFEAFPAFFAAVVVAHLNHVPVDVQTRLAVLWVICRLIYQITYILNIDVLRSFVWFITTAVDVKLFLLSIK